MKKLAFSAVITPSDDSVTMEYLRKYLGQLGIVHFTFESEVETVTVEEMDLPREIWIFVSCDDSEPYQVVTGHHQVDGRNIYEDELAAMRTIGVCIAFHADYPRADRYGAPLYSTDHDFAAGVVGEHGFRVPSIGLEVVTDDRGDDGGEEIWLKIALPASR